MSFYGGRWSRYQGPSECERERGRRGAAATNAKRREELERRRAENAKKLPTFLGRCPGCDEPLTSSRRRYCSKACKQRAYRERQAS